MIPILCYAAVTSLHFFTGSDGNSMTNTVLHSDLDCFKSTVFICIRKTEVAEFLKSKCGILWLKSVKKSTYILSVTAFWKIFVLATCAQRHWSRFKWIVTTHCLWRKTISSVLLCCIVFEVLDGVWGMLGCVCKSMMLWILFFWPSSFWFGFSWCLL